MEELIYYRKQQSIGRHLLGSLVFVAAGLFLTTWPSVFFKLIGASAIIFFGLAAVYNLSCLLRRRPVLVVSTRGVLDQASLLSAGLIHWNEIATIAPKHFRGQLFVSVRLKDFETVLRRHSGLKRLLMKWNMGLVGAHVNIPANTLADNPQAVIEQIMTEYGHLLEQNH